MKCLIHTSIIDDWTLILIWLILSRLEQSSIHNLKNVLNEPTFNFIFSIIIIRKLNKKKKKTRKQHQDMFEFNWMNLDSHNGANLVFNQLYIQMPIYLLFSLIKYIILWGKSKSFEISAINKFNTINLWWNPWLPW